MDPIDREARSLALHQLIVQKIRREPMLVNRVQETLDYWQARNSTPQPLLVKWQRLLDEGVEATLAAAIDTSEVRCALRRSSPFVRILTDDERVGVLMSWSKLRRQGHLSKQKQGETGATGALV